VEGFGFAVNWDGAAQVIAVYNPHVVSNVWICDPHTFFFHAPHDLQKITINSIPFEFTQFRPTLYRAMRDWDAEGIVEWMLSVPDVSALDNNDSIIEVTTADGETHSFTLRWDYGKDTVHRLTINGLTHGVVVKAGEPFTFTVYGENLSGFVRVSLHGGDLPSQGATPMIGTYEMNTWPEGMVPRGDAHQFASGIGTIYVKGNSSLEYVLTITPDNIPPGEYILRVQVNWWNACSGQYNFYDIPFTLVN
jgi:hypothetical protein